MTTPAIKPPKRPYGWSEDDYEMLTELFKAGLTNDEIATAMGRTVSTIAAGLRKMGLNRGLDTCPVCGKDLQQQASGRRRRYCSSACGQAFRGSPQKYKELPPIERLPVCTVCGNQLTMEQARRRTVRGLSLEYCSGTCKQQIKLERDQSVEYIEPL
jgi:YHS domain-containing protein